MGMGWGGRGYKNSLPNFSDPKSAVEGEIETDGKEGGLEKRRRELTEGWRGWWAGSGGWGKGGGGDWRRRKKRRGWGNAGTLFLNSNAAVPESGPHRRICPRPRCNSVALNGLHENYITLRELPHKARRRKHGGYGRHSRCRFQTRHEAANKTSDCCPVRLGERRWFQLDLIELITLDWQPSASIFDSVSLGRQFFFLSPFLLPVLCVMC